MTTTHRVRLGTRGSALATTQSRTVARALEEAAASLGEQLSVELVEVSTRGDVDPTPLAELGGVGVFAAVLRSALLEGECDLAVHSFKDLPTAGVPGLMIAAVPPREDPSDALCTVGGAQNGLPLAQLPRGARIGTGSPRRAAQLLALRPDLQVVALRGNVPTRLARVVGSVVDADGPMGATREPDLDGVVLALSGLRRLGLEGYVSEVLAVSPGARNAPVMVPAATQGALAVETRGDLTLSDPVLAAALAVLDDPLTHAAARAERALMRRLEAGCAAPVGALALPLAVDASLSATSSDRSPAPGPLLHLDAVVVALDGSRLLCRTATGDASDPEALGTAVAQALLADGAAELVNLRATKEGHVHPVPQVSQEASHGSSQAAALHEAPLQGVRVLLPRTKEPDPVLDRLTQAGAQVERANLTRTVPGPLAPRERAARDLAAGAYDWLVLSSPRTLEHVDLSGLPAGTRLAVVGPGTAARVATALGRRPDLVAPTCSADLLGDTPLGLGPSAQGQQEPVTGGRVLLPGSDIASPTLREGLQGAGWQVDAVAAYTTETVEAESLPAGLRGRWTDGGYDVVVLTAGSSARALVDLLGPAPAGTRVVAIGEPTALSAHALGLHVDATASAPTPQGVCSAVQEALSLTVTRPSQPEPSEMTRHD